MNYNPLISIVFLLINFSNIKAINNKTTDTNSNYLKQTNRYITFDGLIKRSKHNNRENPHDIVNPHIVEE